MFRLLLVSALSLVVGCPAGTPVTTDKDTNTDGVTTPPTGDTSVDAPTGMNPVAVGFELFAYVNPDGTLGTWTDGVYEYIPYVLVTFADIEYFYGNTENTTCVVLAPFGSDGLYGGILPKAKPDQIPTKDGSILYASYETALDIDTDPAATDCDELVDPSLWGEDAELLLEPFDGARLGIGFGKMTDYLLDAWQGLSQEDLDLLTPGFLAEYIALNDASGTWLAEDWTTGVLWATDENGVPFTDDEGFLSDVVEVDTLLPGGDLPPGQLRSYAYWYQDFPLLDLSNLKDGAP